MTLSWGPQGEAINCRMLALKAETLFGTLTAVVRESTSSINSASSLLAYGRGLKRCAGAKREWHLRLYSSDIPRIYGINEKESGIYGFIHLTFQEYMASM